MATAAIGIICKAPKAGESKTRLIPRLGPERAAALARAFLIDLARTIDEAAMTGRWTGYAVCSPDSAAAELAAYLPPSFGYLVKTDRDLGRVLDGATREFIARGHESVDFGERRQPDPSLGPAHGNRNGAPGAGPSCRLRSGARRRLFAGGTEAADP